MRFSHLQILFFLVIAFGFGNCDESLKGDPISEGMIEYEISYPKNGSSMETMMPTDMFFYFKKDMSMTEIKGLAGQIRTAFVADNKKKELTVMLKMWTNKIVTTMDHDAINQSFSHRGPYKIKKEKETKEVAGYQCRKATIIFDNEKRDPVTVYYTDRIKLKDPNWSVAYPEIDGVMLEYEIEQDGIYMKLVAQSVHAEEVTVNDFNVPEGYESVSNEHMKTKRLELSEMATIFD